MAERLFGLLRVAALRSNGAKVDEGAAVVGTDFERLLDFSDRSGRVAQPRHRIGAKQHRVDVFRVLRQQALSAKLRVVESTSQQQQFGCLELRVAVVREGVRGADKLRERRLDVPHALVGFRQLQSRLAKFRVEFHRAGVLDRGELVALFPGVFVAALDVLQFLGLRVVTRRQQR